MNKVELMKTANEVRKGIIEAVHSAKSGHPGGSLSATKQTETVLYCPKDTQLQVTILYWHREDIFR